jgi:S-DNA-T family DNA segregation ATPase FtsK/SpoIIIE
VAVAFGHNPTMSFPLGSLRGEGGAAMAARPAADGLASVPLRKQLWLFAGAVLWLLAMLALVTHSSADAGFSTSGNGQAIANKAGLVGAWAADFALFMLGHSVWWLPLVAARAWLTFLARELRGPGTAPLHKAVFWVGLAMLMAASCALEATRLYRFETSLPGHAGGVLGYALGPLSVKWLGFAGSGVFWIALLVTGMSLSLRFSWLRLAEQVGSAIDRLRQRREVQRELAEDVRLGQAALREREEVVAVERVETLEHFPVVIE